MKKYMTLILVVCFIVTLTSCKDSAMFTFNYYTYIQYNGINYYTTPEQHPPCYNYGEKVAVYLGRSSTVDYKHVYYADTYVGDDEHLYLFFDSAIYKKSVPDTVPPLNSSQ